MLSLIAELDKNGAIGYNGKVPWYGSGLSQIDRLTYGHICIMGGNTFRRLENPLRDRITWVLSRSLPQPEFSPNRYRYFVVKSAPILLALINDYVHQEEIFLCGGRQIYQRFGRYVDRMHLTAINEDTKYASANAVYFPWESFADMSWACMEQFPLTPTNAPIVTNLNHFYQFDRIS